LQQLASLLDWNLPLPFISRKASLVAAAFNGEIALVVARTHTQRKLVRFGYVALAYACDGCGVLNELATNQKLTFYFSPHGAAIYY
jgi:hypothetical protein